MAKRVKKTATAKTSAKPKTRLVARSALKPTALAAAELEPSATGGDSMSERTSRPPLPKILSFVAASQPAFQISVAAIDDHPASCLAMLGDPEKSSKMNAVNIANARSLSSSSVGVVYPLYYAADPYYQPAAGAHAYRRADSSEFIGIAGLDGSLYMLGASQSRGSLVVSGEVWATLSARGGEVPVPANRISTVAYVSADGQSGLHPSDIPALSTSQFLCEVPETAKQDFSTGKLLADAHLVKNFMDGQYVMRHLSSRAIDNSRRYVGIGSCGSKLYLAYRDDVDVSADGVSASSSGTCGLSVDVPLVETVNSIRRVLDNGHEPRIASLYSIDVTTQILNKLREHLASTLDDESLENAVVVLRNQIRDDISKIAAACSPAQLQLFDVLLNGEPTVE